MKPFLRNNRKGFTLIELILAVMLLLAVLVIGFNLYTYINRSFLMAATYTNVQREMRRAANYISNELRTSYEVKLANSPTINDYYDKNFNCLYLENGSIVHRYKEQETNGFINKTVLDGNLDNVNYDIVFSKAIDEEGDEKGKVLTFLMTVDKMSYQIESSIIVQNLTEKQEIEDPDNLNSAQYIYYTKLRAIEEGERDSSGGDRRCFIATAAYGSYQEPAVMILRDFRDNYLLTNPLGRKLVRVYYTFTPPIAQIIAGNEMLRGLVRLMLSPFIVIAYATVVPGGVFILLLFFIGYILTIFLRIRKSIMLWISTKFIEKTRGKD